MMRNRRDVIAGVATALGGVAVLSSEAALAATAGAGVSFNVLYPNHDGARFDMAHYRGTHIPMVERIMKPASTLLIEGVPMAGKAPPYVMIVHCEFPSVEALQVALGNPAMGELRDDLVKFTDIKPVIMLGKS